LNVIERLILQPGLRFQSGVAQPTSGNFEHASSLSSLEVTLELQRQREGVSSVLWTMISVLLAFWLVGLIAHIGGGLIHLLLVVAAVVFIVQLFTGRRAI
jgi:Family of unknown function (DUF5670)